MAFFICPPKFQLMGTSVGCTLTCFELVIKFVSVLLDTFQLVDAIETGLIWSLFSPLFNLHVWRGGSVLITSYISGKHVCQNINLFPAGCKNFHLADDKLSFRAWVDLCKWPLAFLSNFCLPVPVGRKCISCVPKTTCLFFIQYVCHAELVVL